MTFFVEAHRTASLSGRYIRFFFGGGAVVTSNNLSHNSIRDLRHFYCVHKIITLSRENQR